MIKLGPMVVFCSLRFNEYEFCILLDEYYERMNLTVPIYLPIRALGLC